jgi:hypothetical protein
MAVQVSIPNVDNGLGRSMPREQAERERRLQLTARRRRLAKLRRTAETAAWIVGSLALAAVAVAGLAGLR